MPSLFKKAKHTNVMLSQQAEAKREKRKKRLESTVIFLLSFLAGCLVKRLLSG